MLNLFQHLQADGIAGLLNLIQYRNDVKFEIYVKKRLLRSA